MKVTILLILLGPLLFSGCVPDEMPTECSVETNKYLEGAEQVYKQRNAAIRNPDGSFTTNEQCKKQHQLAVDFLEQYKLDQKEVNTEKYYKEGCTEDELKDINNVFERLIMEMEGDAYIYYSCD